jgi:signal peptidase I
VTGRPAWADELRDDAQPRPGPTTSPEWDPWATSGVGDTGERQLPLPRSPLEAVAAEDPTAVDPGRDATNRAWRETRFYAGALAVFLLCSALSFALIVVAAALMPGWATVYITSDSMAPAIRRGDVVIGLVGAPVETGRVIVFEDPAGGLITHRVMEIDPDGRYLTAGDANRATDSTPVDPERVRAGGRLLVPMAGWPLIWLAEGSWPQLIALVIAASLLVRVSRYGLLDRYTPWEVAAARQTP